MNDVLLNKKVSMERCIKQINTYYKLDTGCAFKDDFLKQDAIAINLQRMAELAIDMAAYTIKKFKWGLPKDSRDHFAILEAHGVIDADLANKLKNMVGFRNVLVHEYQTLDIQKMIDVIEHHLPDLMILDLCTSGVREKNEEKLSWLRRETQ